MMTFSWFERLFLPKKLLKESEEAEARLERAKAEAAEIAQADAAINAELEKLCILTEDRTARIASAPPVTPRLASLPDWDPHEEPTWDGSKG